MSKEMAVTRYRRSKGSKFKTVPGLTITNAELRQRVKDRSIVIDPSGNVYSTDPDIIQAARMSKIENSREYLKDVQKTTNLKRKVEGSIKENQIKNAKEQGRKEGLASKGGTNE